MPADLGFTSHGTGPVRVVVLHDWFCDHSSWDAALPYLTPARFTYVFADLRGYGASREIAGAYTLDEAASDVIALADKLGWTQFSLVGHSMSGLVVQRMAQLVPRQISRIVAMTPAPPGGMGLDQAAVDLFRSIALANDGERFAALAGMWGSRLSETWIWYKLRRWRETAVPAAVAKYVELWGCSDISQAARGVATPMLIVAGAQDAPPFQAAALEKSLLPYYPRATMISLAESGHYPMQEQPPLLATLMERFLGE
jgi:pimeloyl-ACP methyl ester carboxylesterase